MNVRLATQMPCEHLPMQVSLMVVVIDERGVG
jgi:hypothetical protein